MDWEKELIYDIEKEKDITKNVCLISLNEDSTRYNIVFLDALEKTYSYKTDRILYFQDPKEIETNDFIFFNGKVYLTNVKRALLFNDFLRIQYENGDLATYEWSNIVKVKNLRNDAKVSEALNYLIEVASKDKEVESTELEEEPSFLENLLTKLEVREDSALAVFLREGAKPKEIKIAEPLIAPFSANASQIKSTWNGLRSQISIIEGPPGTGKTQTILNIIANLLVRGKTVAVVSGNNEATQNVYEKMEKEGLAEFCAVLGNKEKREKFFSMEHTKEQFKNMPKLDIPSPEDEAVRRLLNDAIVLYKANIKKAKIRAEIRELEVEKRANDNSFAGLKITKSPRIFSKELSSSQCLRYAAYIEDLYSRKIPNLIKKIKVLIKFGLGPKKDFSPSNLFDYFQNRYYKEKLREDKECLKELVEKYPKYKEAEVFKEFYLSSKKRLFDSLEYKCENLENCDFDIQTYRNSAQFFNHFPVVLSTTHSIQYCTQRHRLFDYIIVDEASQVGLTSAVLALAACENVIIVGDSKQLPHVVPSKLEGALDCIRGKYKLPEFMDYRRYSLLESVKARFGSSVPSTLLNEHYRCDPDIIGFCNKRFYNNALVIQSEHKEGRAIEIVECPSHSEHNRMNEMQATALTDEILPQIKNKKDVGVVAPYRNQVNLIRQKIGNKEILVDTVHKFQGKERSIMILSTTSDRTRFYDDPEHIDFLNNSNLINVAISRAKDKLFFVASEEALRQENTLVNDFYKYCQYNLSDYGFEKSKISSVFELMYSDYNKEQKSKVSKFDSENIIYELLDKLCKSGEFGPISVLFNYPLRKIVDADLINDKADKAFVLHPNTHCDFVVYNLLDKSVRLVVEVDGKQHDMSLQKMRDARKDRILSQAGIRIIRIETTAVKVEEKIRLALKSC